MAEVEMCRKCKIVVQVGRVYWGGVGSVGSMPGNSATAVVCNHFCDNAHLVPLCGLRSHSQCERKFCIDTVWCMSEVLSRI